MLLSIIIAEDKDLGNVSGVFGYIQEDTVKWLRKEAYYYGLTTVEYAVSILKQKSTDTSNRKCHCMVKDCVCIRYFSGPDTVCEPCRVTDHLEGKT